MKIVKNTQPPTTMRRFACRLPIYVYRLGLGWLSGEPIMLRPTPFIRFVTRT